MVHTVLIVDSEPAQRDLLIHSLQNRLGYCTVAAASAAEAEKYFSESAAIKPDIILFDWSTKNADDDTASLRQLASYAPLVVLVRYGDYEMAASALYAGASDFLVKPVAIERISTTFRNLLLMRDACREAERLRREYGAPDARSVSSPMPQQTFELIGTDGNIRRMEDIENEVIRFAMQFYHGRMTEVARRLGIGRSTLYRKLGGFGARNHHAEAA